MQSMGIPMGRLAEPPRDREAWVKGGPISPQTAMVVGAWFLTREVELSCTRGMPRADHRRNPDHSFMVPPGKQVGREGQWRGAHASMRLQEEVELGVPRLHDEAAP